MSVEEETLAANKTVVVRFNKEVIEQGNEATLGELTFASAPRGLHAGGPRSLHALEQAGEGRRSGLLLATRDGVGVTLLGEASSKSPGVLSSGSLARWVSEDRGGARERGDDA
jgi:hypothetical protein